MRKWITYIKNMQLTGEETDGLVVNAIHIGPLYRAYCQVLRQRRKMDYDDQMVYAYRILRQYPEILADVQRRYWYFCVDEAQDTSKIQHALLQVLAQGAASVFMVGDEDQSIYGFRAAYPQALTEFEARYPGAKVLVATKQDFEPKNRKKFCARIATGDYDAVIIGHSQFEKIPISRERQERLLYEQIDEITEGIAEVQASGGERFTVKQLERTRKSLEARLEKLQAESRKDDVVTFEQLGVDRLFVDEAHNYKNLFLYTKMRNVAGLSTSDAQKSSDMFAKCRYMDEITGSRGVIFATGTPVSNSMTELYTMQRYLQYDRLQELSMTHFDCWASRFGETTTALELAPEGYTLVGR